MASCAMYTTWLPEVLRRRLRMEMKNHFATIDYLPSSQSYFLMCRTIFAIAIKQSYLLPALIFLRTQSLQLKVLSSGTAYCLLLFTNFKVQFKFPLVFLIEKWSDNTRLLLLTWLL